MDELAAQGRTSGVSADVRPALAFAVRLAAICSRVLGETLASVILHGSLALGDYAPGKSDIDVAATPSEAPPMELYVRLDPPAPPEVVSRVPGEPDLIVELSLCRESGEALLGAAPRELIGVVPDRWVLRQGDTYLARSQSLTDDARHTELRSRPSAARFASAAAMTCGSSRSSSPACSRSRALGRALNVSDEGEWDQVDDPCCGLDSARRKRGRRSSAPPIR